jgi:hypothetical protein
VLAGGCGPTEAEIGSAIVHAAPPMIIIGFTIQWNWRSFFSRCGY